jgi:hypothetical protein
MKCRAAFSATIRPVGTLPVKQTTSERRTRASPVSRAPGSTASTAASSGTASIERRTGSTKRGVISLGFTSTAQPASSAGIASMKHSDSGKFHGLMMPTRPYGTYCET